MDLDKECLQLLGRGAGGQKFQALLQARGEQVKLNYENTLNYRRVDMGQNLCGVTTAPNGQEMSSNQAREFTVDLYWRNRLRFLFGKVYVRFGVSSTARPRTINQTDDMFDGPEVFAGRPNILSFF